MFGGVQLADRACYLVDEELLVVADIHLGFDESSAVTLPVGEREAVIDQLEGLLDAFEPRTLVVAGDFLHSFDSIPRGVPETVAAVERTVAEAGATLRITRGNHDTMLDEIDLQSPVSQMVEVGETIIAHGHEEITESASRYIIGHDHPTIEIDGRRYPCILLGSGVWDEGDVLVLPALSPLVRGTPVNELRGGDALSPMLVETAAFRPVVVAEDDVYRFPPLRELRSYL